MKIVAVANQKGGVGKTVIAAHLAMYSAKSGFSTLLIDMDEGDVGNVFGVSTDDVTSGSSQLFTGGDVNLLTVKVRDQLSLIPADVELLNIDEQPLSIIENVYPSLQNLSPAYDLIVIDTPPNLQRRMIGALAAATHVLTPFNVDAFSVARLPKLFTTIEVVQRELNPTLESMVFINNLATKRGSETSAVSDFRNALGARLLDSVIPSRSVVSSALAQGQAVWEYKRSGNQRAAVNEMRSLCEEVLARVGLAGRVE